MFKSNLNEIVRGKYKSKEQKRTIQKIKLLYEAVEAGIKLLNYYSSVVSEAKYIAIYGKQRRFMENNLA